MDPDDEPSEQDLSRSANLLYAKLLMATLNTLSSFFSPLHSHNPLVSQSIPQRIILLATVFRNALPSSSSSAHTSVLFPSSISSLHHSSILLLVYSNLNLSRLSRASKFLDLLAVHGYPSSKLEVLRRHSIQQAKRKLKRDRKIAKEVAGFVEKVMKDVQDAERAKSPEEERDEDGLYFIDSKEREDEE